MFSWTEVGAKHIGIVQSLLVTCRLYDVDPYDYLVDVLQRVGVCHLQNVFALVGIERMRRHWPCRSGALVTSHQSVIGLPALQRAHINPGHVAGLVQARPGRVCSVDVLG